MQYLGRPTTTVGQYDEPLMVATESADMPFSAAGPSTSATAMPLPSSSGPSLSVPSTSNLRSVPMTAHQLSVLSLPNTGEPQRLDVDNH